MNRKGAKYAKKSIQLCNFLRKPTDIIRQ